jgi:hypothetical protein
MSDADSADALAQAELKAILNLDFELALDLYSRRTRAVDRATDAEEGHYFREAQRLLDESQEAYAGELTRISTTLLEDSERYKSVWQGLGRSLIDRHRGEAADLEHRWRDARAIEKRRTEEAVEVQLGAARVLAMCQKFCEAIVARDAAQALLVNDETDELRAIDADYAGRYRAMITRHEGEFQDLSVHLNSLMRALNDRAQRERSVAHAHLQAQNASNARMIIESVSENAVSAVARERVIQAFSPRRSAAPRSRSRGSSGSSPSRTETPPS